MGVDIGVLEAADWLQQIDFQVHPSIFMQVAVENHEMRSLVRRLSVGSWRLQKLDLSSVSSGFNRFSEMLIMLAARR